MVWDEVGMLRGDEGIESVTLNEHHVIAAFHGNGVFSLSV